MSLRAIKKRESSLVNSSNSSSSQRLFKKSGIVSPKKLISNRNSSTALNLKLQRQQKLLGRFTQSTPELRSNSCEHLIQQQHLIRTRSADDVNSILSNNQAAGNSNHSIQTATGLFAAKSEICLQTISSHSYSKEKQLEASRPIKPNKMSGARSHRDLTYSSYAANNSPPSIRRLSESHSGMSSSYSQRASSMSGSALTLHSTSNCTDANAVLRVPIIGYEVMEERARFTVYKLRVENPQNNDCWLVLRRYTDFVRLNNKMKQAFPQLSLQLPRKKLFGDNFNSVFLDNRVQGLQIFVNSVMAKEELRHCKLVREFFCLDEPPTYSESMEECRAIFEAQEETIAHLKLQISNKDDVILTLQQKLREEVAAKEQLKETLRNTSLNCSHCSSAN